MRPAATTTMATGSDGTSRDTTDHTSSNQYGQQTTQTQSTAATGRIQRSWGNRSRTVRRRHIVRSAHGLRHRRRHNRHTILALIVTRQYTRRNHRGRNHCRFFRRLFLYGGRHANRHHSFSTFNRLASTNRNSFPAGSDSTATITDSTATNALSDWSGHDRADFSSPSANRSAFYDFGATNSGRARTDNFRRSNWDCTTGASDELVKFAHQWTGAARRRSTVCGTTFNRYGASCFTSTNRNNINIFNRRLSHLFRTDRHIGNLDNVSGTSRGHRFFGHRNRLRCITRHRIYILFTSRHCRRIHCRLHSLRNPRHIERLIEINFNIRSFDIPFAVALFDFQKFAVRIDLPIILNDVVIALTLHFDVPVPRQKLINPFDNQFRDLRHRNLHGANRRRNRTSRTIHHHVADALMNSSLPVHRIMPPHPGRHTAPAISHIAHTPHMPDHTRSAGRPHFNAARQ